MKINSIKNIGGAILGLLLFLGITVMSSTTAQAQYQDPYWRQREAQRQREIHQRPKNGADRVIYQRAIR